LGLGIGAVSTIEGRRWRTTPRLAGYLASLARGRRPVRELEELSSDVQGSERVLLGLRLDEPLTLGGLEDAVDWEAVGRLEGLGLVRRTRSAAGSALALTTRGRFLGGGVTGGRLAQHPWQGQGPGSPT